MLRWLMLALFAVVRPASWSAPHGTYVNGVRLDGSFEARPVLGRYADDLEDARRRRNIRDDRVLHGRVYCAVGRSPRQDGMRVWCQR